MTPHPTGVSEYNLDQWRSVTNILEVLEKMSDVESTAIRESAREYLAFREELDLFHRRHAEAHCIKTCFDTHLSACCGFESIFTFFADQVLTLLFSDELERTETVAILEKPNRSKRCVYLGARGCVWKLRPISCAMFFCDEVKTSLIQEDELSREEWEALQQREKEFTWPDKRVLFDTLEKAFIQRGVDSKHMYFHKSPGLLRVKARAGLQ